MHVFNVFFNIEFRRKDKGPINFQAMVPQSILTQALVFSICREYKITSADIFCKCDATIDQLIDVIEGNRRYIPCVYVLNKIDQLTIEELDIIDQLPHHVPISAAQEWNLDELMESIWEYTRMIRIYTKVSNDYTSSRFTILFNGINIKQILYCAPHTI